MAVLTPGSLEDVLAALARYPDALVLAGGTDLMVAVNEAHRRLTGEETVVAVGRVPELRTWIHDPLARSVRLGAGVTYGELEAGPLAALLPALAQAART
ncbi:MAG: FAD binding domain-containing protein, partial [Ilumatobacteraceae bacterium]